MSVDVSLRSEKRISVQCEEHHENIECYIRNDWTPFWNGVVELVVH